jgi:hypothetical protein
MIAPYVKHRYAVFPGAPIRLNDKDRGVVGEGMWFEMLINSVRAYRHANGIPIGLEFETEVCRVLCQQVPGACEESDPRQPPPNRGLSVTDVIHGTVAFTKDIVSGQNHVSVEEATRRANICRGCRHNVGWSRPCSNWMCAGVGEVMARVGQLPSLGGLEESLNSCKVCGCLNRISVFYDLALQQSVLTAEQRDQFAYLKEIGHPCWKAQ